MLQMGDHTEDDYLSEFSFLQAGQAEEAFLFAQTNKCLISPSWILLDSQSTVPVFNNRALLTNIRPSPRTLRVHMNGGTQMSTKMGTVKNFGDVWFNPDSLANILSMAEMRKIRRIVTMDTSVEATMNVHRKDGSIMQFKEYHSGLYYFDYLFLNTVADNQSMYTRREIEGADRARALYKKIGRPSEQEFTEILQNNLIRNCPVTPNDAKRALNI
jgi:hypothetical protein